MKPKTGEMIFAEAISLLCLQLTFCACAFGQISSMSDLEALKIIQSAEVYKLKADEFWPEEVAHLFANEREEENMIQVPASTPSPSAFPSASTPSTPPSTPSAPPSTPSAPPRSTEGTKKLIRRKRIETWIAEPLEFREDSWDEPDQAALEKQKKLKEPFVAYKVNDTYVMSRCSSTSGAATLVIACPQPRGSNFHRIVNRTVAYYGWSQIQGSVCQYVDGDCWIRYEFLHKQLMKPTTPQWFDEWRKVGPQYFCNPWDGNGRDDWAQNSQARRWCSIGMKRASQAPRVDDEQANRWGNKYLYSWGSCGSSYDWFDYLHVQYECDDVMEPIDPDATRPYHYRYDNSYGSGYKPDGCATTTANPPPPTTTTRNGTQN